MEASLIPRPLPDFISQPHSQALMRENEGTQTLAEKRASLEPRLSVPDFVSQLWRKVRFFSKAARQNQERKAWV